MFKKKIIYGCEESGNAQSPYLIRYTLFECKAFQICIHVFFRSDNTEHHDHPWNFLSIILWRGYYEETVKDLFGRPQLKRVYPGMFLFRKANHRHRVVLVNEKKAVTLVIMGRYVRDWGFFTKNGWLVWTQYFKQKGCKSIKPIPMETIINCPACIAQRDDLESRHQLHHTCSERQPAAAQVVTEGIPAVERPPVGLMPKWLWIETRHSAIVAAIERYTGAGIPIPAEWWTELFELDAVIYRTAKKAQQ